MRLLKLLVGEGADSDDDEDEDELKDDGDDVGDEDGDIGEYWLEGEDMLLLLFKLGLLFCWLNGFARVGVVANDDGSLSDLKRILLLFRIMS